MAEATGPIRFTGDVWAHIERHVSSCLPDEAVGIIGGRPGIAAVLAVALPNLGGRREFLADPFAQYRAERQISEAGLEVVAIYHSHPGGAPCLSAADEYFAKAWPCVHLVVVPHDSGRVVEARAFRLEGGRTHEVIVVVEGWSAVAGDRPPDPVRVSRLNSSP